MHPPITTAQDELQRALADHGISRTEFARLMSLLEQHDPTWIAFKSFYFYRLAHAIYAGIDSELDLTDELPTVTFRWGYDGQYLLAYFNPRRDRLEIYLATA